MTMSSFDKKWKVEAQRWRFNYARHDGRMNVQRSRIASDSSIPVRHTAALFLVP
jgi:hypothetical protein